MIDRLARGNLVGDWSVCGSAAGTKIEAEVVAALVDGVVVVESNFDSAALELDFLRS